jgi:D-glycero-D-manno-heptose 1,7-bisphosphate phosphatase
MNKALFLDRDGVINVHEGYTFRKEDFIFIDGIFGLCRKYFDEGFLIIVITNQAGIAKGLFTEDDFISLSEWVKARFMEEGIKISKVLYCPHHPDYSGPCSCRKPEPGMILEAAHEFELDLGECHLIGDMESDIEAGRRAGIPENNLFLVKEGGFTDCSK